MRFSDFKTLRLELEEAAPDQGYATLPFPNAKTGIFGTSAAGTHPSYHCLNASAISPPATKISSTSSISAANKTELVGGVSCRYGARRRPSSAPWGRSRRRRSRRARSSVPPLAAPPRRGAAGTQGSLLRTPAVNPCCSPRCAYSQAHGPGGLLAYCGSILDGTFSDLRCDLDAHYGECFVRGRLTGYAFLAALAVFLVNCCLLAYLRA